jgi:hypothetical protein
MEPTSQTESITTIPFSEFPAFINARVLEKKVNVYCILDGASDNTIYPMLKSNKWDYFCLYKKNVHFEGERMVDELAATAPYLLKLDPDKMSVESIVRERMGKSQMIIFESPAPIEKLLDHCSSMLKAMDEDGKVINFRYYDPRILRVYLPTCTDEESYIFFGDIDTVWADGEGEVILEFDKFKKEPVKEASEEPVVEQKDDEPAIAEEKKELDINPDGGFGVMGDFFKESN